MKKLLLSTAIVLALCTYAGAQQTYTPQDATNGLQPPAQPQGQLTNSPSITAAGTTLATATRLSSDLSMITTVASGSGIALRPWSPVPGFTSRQEVFNAGANALLTYPPVSTASIWANGTTGAAGAAVSLALGAHATFECVSLTLCYEAP